ncbi:MAG: ATP-dependent sacrificial sulfur transferase LarE [Clostridia bacterium]|nr:ATP-dependent sacrificial sulfur transferase LarE [Clostridia bacterium]
MKEGCAVEPIQVKYESLKSSLAQFGRVAVAFSAGVDSALLLKAAHDALGGNAVAVTVRHAAFPGREGDEARAFCGALGVRLIEIELDVFAVDGFAANPPQRCYLCKRAVFERILTVAAQHGFPVVAEGSNLDDAGDYRPGLRALAELGVKSPLRDAGLTKADIRALSKALGLPTWNKPSYACLATRVPYGEAITPEKLAMIETAEQVLLDLGFRQCRVRHHGAVARIEIEAEAFALFMQPDVRAQVNDRLRDCGFLYVALDLRPYRTGSLNDALRH